MAQHVLFISYDGMTDPLGQSQVLPYLFGLRKKGYTVSLISFEKPDRFATDGVFIRGLCTKNNIHWHPQTYTKRPPVLSTVFDIWKMKRAFRKIHAQQAVNLLHCRSYISAFIGRKQLQKNGIPWIFDMRGFWADERVEGGIWNLSNPLYKRIYRFFKRKEKAFFTESTAVVSLTHAGKEEILSWKLPNVSDPKITVIPCCVDLELFNPASVDAQAREEKRETLDIEGKRVVGYVGSIGTWYMLTEMLETFKQLQKEDRNSVFLFVTREPGQHIVQVATELGIDQEAIRVVSSLHRDVPLYISLFDCSIFFIRPSFSKTASSPTKQGELMAMGIPVICNSGVGDTAKVVEHYNAGLVMDLNTGNLQCSFAALEQQFVQENAMRGAQEFYSLESGISSYDSVYKACLSAQK